MYYRRLVRVQRKYGGALWDKRCAGHPNGYLLVAKTSPVRAAVTVVPETV